MHARKIFVAFGCWWAKGINTLTVGTITQCNLSQLVSWQLLQHPGIQFVTKKSSAPANERALKKNLYVSRIEIVTRASEMHACKIEFNISIHKVRLFLYSRKNRNSVPTKLSRLMLNPLCSNRFWVIFASCSWHALSMWILQSLWSHTTLSLSYSRHVCVFLIDSTQKKDLMSEELASNLLTTFFCSQTQREWNFWVLWSL